uniref:TPX2 C-terminal domain-containing protein n=1 Tax=Manihot esculenta TaxID=3983 RepID=A0A2C9U8K4_MANES
MSFWQGDPVYALGQSISFGKFVSESLAWKKCSTFSHNRYVEEAKRFSRPGSVAQKKAFFEAHFKNLAARKAAALLEQANAAANNVPESAQEGGVQENAAQDDNGHNSHVEMEKSESRNVEEVDPGNDEKMKETELSRRKLMEKPSLKDLISNGDHLDSRSNNKPVVYSSELLFSGTASKLPCTPAKAAASVIARKDSNATPIRKKSAIDFMGKKKSTPKSTYRSMNFTPVREINRITSAIIRKIDCSKVTSDSKALKDCPTPPRTPTTVPVIRELEHPLASPLSENKRATTPLHPSASGSKTVRSKWLFLPTDCSKFMSACRNKSPSPNLSTPFSLRTEERAARRKERLEEKFNANQAQTVQLQATLKEKAETELKRLRQTLCFKARPLPEFYRERATTKNQVEKSPNIGRTSTSNPSMAQSTSQPHNRSSFKNGRSKHAMGKKSENSLSLASRFRSITRENTSQIFSILDDEKFKAW